jgi:hypothetical protein
VALRDGVREHRLRGDGRVSNIICVVCERRVTDAIEVEGTLWCVRCFERVNPITLEEQARLARRRARAKGRTA